MSVVVGTKRKTFQSEEDNSVGNSISVGEAYEPGELRFEIDNPWSGDTESGFGRTTHIQMSLEDARALGTFLLAITKEPK